MKCTDSKKEHRKKIRRKKIIRRRITVAILLVCLLSLSAFAVKLFLTLSPKNLVAEYEAETYNSDVYRAGLWASGLCVAAENVTADGAPDTSKLKAAALFDLNQKKVNFAYNMHEKLYPASTTKIMTALVALKNGNMSDVVTVSPNAVDLAPDEQTCGLKAGDKLTLKDLINGLLIYSGNDNAIAIAEHLGGTEEKFAEMMNVQAKELMATNTHFVNASGLHNEDHYTTAYDLYLIFNECIKNQEFLDILQTTSYTSNITSADGSLQQITWRPTNFYATGEAVSPENAVIVGGKTGTTKEAGNCLILLENDQDGNAYISVVMGADTKPILYEDMTALIRAIPGTSSADNVSGNTAVQ